MKIKKIYGPPGTGKTSRLVKAVEKAIRQNIPAKKIGYFSFSTEAAHTARDRVLKTFSQEELESKGIRRLNDFGGLSTIHALAFKISNMLGTMVMHERHFEEICSSIGLDYHTYSKELIPRPPKGYIGDRMCSYYHTIRSRLQDPYDTSVLIRDELFTREEFNRFCKTVDAYKEQRGMYDFNDMLDAGMMSDVIPEFELLLIDEAQDLSKLQWKFVRLLIDKSKFALIAGDDDQAIYEWAGASPETFVNLPVNEEECLNQSYRIPGAVHMIAEMLRRHMPESVPKSYNARETMGLVQWEQTYEDIDMSQGEWAILVRHKGQKKRIEEYIEKTGWNIVCKTIHSVKGAEFENVVLMTDMSRSSYSNYLENPSSEIRVFYVGLTRTKNRLYIINPQRKLFFDLLV